MIRHASDCPVMTGSHAAACTCDAVAIAIVEQASRPTPAELIRAAKNRGLIQSVQGYA